LIPGFIANDVTPAATNSQPVQPPVAPTIASAPIPQRLTHAATFRTFIPPTTSTSEDSDDDGHQVPPPTPHTPFDMTDTNATLTPRHHESYIIWRHFTILNQVIKVTLYVLHTVMISVKMKCLLSPIKNLVQILKS
jgi:hypothetical protein